VSGRVLKTVPKSLSIKNPKVPILLSNPPLVPAARCRRGVPESNPATLTVPTISVFGSLAKVINISVFALDGGAIIPSQIASPGNLLAATVPSMASTGISLSSSNHSRKIFSASSSKLDEGCAPRAADPTPGCVPGGGGGGGEVDPGCDCGCDGPGCVPGCEPGCVPGCGPVLACDGPCCGPGCGADWGWD